ncbi:MAG: glycosyltransferase family 4 protein [Muribaculaceae bacterium]|nr:glycosyltransferase family 4 protein [Muribaculaceae bacterium]
MNIIHLVRATTWGGGERYALDLCRRSVETGDNVTVITRGVPFIDEKFARAGATIKRMPLGGIFDLTSPIRIARMVREMKGEPVIFHVHTFKDAEIVTKAKKIIGKRGNVKLVCTRHLVKPGKSSFRWKKIYAGIDSLIFISNLAKETFLESNPPVTLDRLAVVHNSVAVPKKYSVPMPPPSSQTLNILFTGRISPEKGIDVLIESIGKLSDIPLRLQIAGTGKPEYVKQLQDLATLHHITDRIEWIGFAEDVYEKIVKADICVAPSVWAEPFGLTIIEFMSQARPVITTDNGAQKEIITDGVEGFLVGPSDPDAIASAIRKLSSDKNLREKMGEKAFRTFRSRFAYDIFFNRIRDIYKSVGQQYQYLK